MSDRTSRPSVFAPRRILEMGAVAILGVSQPLFNLILNNSEEFPSGGLFHVWVLLWAFLLPLFALTCADALAERLRDRVFHAWRGLLAALLAASCLRQAYVYYALQIDLWSLTGTFPPLAIAAAAVLLAAAMKWPAEARRFLAALGLMASLFTAAYIARSGVWGPAWAASGAGPAQATEPAERPLFLVVFDELSMDVLLKDGRIDSAAYPHFAAFAEENAWFSAASSNHMFTTDSIPCMLTGRFHPDRTARTLFHYLQRRYNPKIVGGWPFLSHWMKRGAREAAAFEHRGSLEELSRHPWEAAKILLDGLGTGLLGARPSPAVPGGDAKLLAASFNASSLKQTELIADLLRTSAGPGLFVYWHSPVPHWPFVFDAHGRRHGRPHVVFFDPVEDPRAVYENYREQTRLADRLFGRFVEVLRQADLYERAIILVTSDHGLRTFDKLQPDPYPELIGNHVPGVPLLVKAPGVPPGRHAEDYQHIDLVPTLLDLAGVPVPPGAFDGVSLLASERPARAKIFSKRDRTYVFDPASGLWRQSEKPR